MASNSCPCCGSLLLQHVRSSGTYWFCQTCWQEVPLIVEREYQYISYEPTPKFTHHTSTKPVSRYQKLLQKVKA